MAKEKLVEEDELEPKELEQVEDKAPVKEADEEQEETLRSEDNENEVMVDAEGNQLSEDELRDLRERRRKKRMQAKEKRREAMLRDKAQIESLKRQIEELQGKAQLFEKRVSNQDVAQLDAAMAQLKDYIARANEAYAMAIKEGNGEAAAKADEARYEARRRLDSIANTRQQMQRAQSVRPEPQMDPRVVSMARAWMDKNRWYSPQGDDEDSAIALVVEKRISAEGFDPSTPEYWSELDRRIAKRLPHRNSVAADDDDDDDDDEAPPPRRVASTQRPPMGGGNRGGVGAGREVARVPKEFVDQLKEAGLWDDQKKRDEMIKRYQAAKQKYA